MKRSIKRLMWLPSWMLVSLLCWPYAAFAATDPAQLVQRLKAPPGFKVELYAEGLPNARTLVMGDNGTLFVGTRRAGNVYAIHNGRQYRIASGLDMPNGIAFRNGSLYVAEISRILRYDNIESQLHRPPKAVVIRDDLPDKTHHGWRYIGFGPDDRLYFAVGAPCNVCLEKGFAVIRSIRPDGTDERIEAEGIRNSVGFTWHPKSKKLWLTDNGRDWLGDDLPPDEINRVDRSGQHFGFPFCHGGVVQDPEFRRFDCKQFSPPARALGAHVAPLGIIFYTGSQFPAEYQGRAFVAEHGSWNRSTKSGYRIAMAILKGDEVVDYQTFLSGWLDGQTTLGRPAYLLQMPDGSLLVSDDMQGAIYRISYSGTS